MEQTLRQTVAGLITRHIVCYSEQECSQILAGLNVITSFDLNINRQQPSINLDVFQESLSRINEKELRRRDEGVYYTPKDATEYVVANTYLNYVCPDNNQVYSVDKCLQILAQADNSKLTCAKVFDPTCGTAEFLLSAINIKLRIIACDTDDAILNLIENNKLTDIETYKKQLSNINNFNLKQYKSSQYRRMGEDLYKNFFENN